MPNHRWDLAATWLWLGLMWNPLPAAPLPAPRASAPYFIEVKDTEDGLPQNSVIAMTQTRDGYLWLGTLGGLVRFDGIRFTVFDENNTPGLLSSEIVSLFEDSQGNLWVGTESAGILRISDGQIHRPTEISLGGRERRLKATCEDSAGAVWFYSANGDLWRHRNGQYEPFVVEPARPSDCRAMIAEPGGPVWVATDTSQYGLSQNPEPGSVAPPVEQLVPVSNRLDFLLAGKRGGYWRLADGSVQKWTTNRLERQVVPYRWTAHVEAACEDPDGNLVVGTRGEGVFWLDSEGGVTSLSSKGVLRYDAQGLVIFQSPKPALSHDRILSLLVDREGTLWVGTDGRGLNLVKRQVFEVLEESRGMVIQSVSEDDQGGLWFAARSGGVYRWKDGALQGFLPILPFRSIFADRSGRVWAGTWQPGLFQFRGGRYQAMTGGGAADPEVQAIHQDRQGRLWFGTRGGLLGRDEDGWKVIGAGLSSEVVRALADDAEGTLWIGTEAGGLHRLRDSQFTGLRKEAGGLPSDNVSSLLVDADGVLWIGTSSGLARLHQGRWTRYTTREGLILDSVGFLLEDGQGNLWIGSNAGLMRVPKQALNDFANGATNFIPCRAYGTPDGLPIAECGSGSQPGACRARDGRLWFPTIDGLVQVDPARLRPNSNPPPVIIESVLIDDAAQKTNALRSGWSRPVTVPAGRERLDIHYTSLNLAAPERARRFKYRMEGHETAWVDAGEVRSAHYTKLPPGRYRFQVTACNEDGYWNETGSSLAFIVEPPFWRTWWFLTASVLGLLGSIIASVHYVSTQKLQRQLEGMRQQEALERERSRIARDLHDQLGASLTQVSLLGEMAESDKHLPEEVEAHARQITQTARETTRVLDEIVWAVNPSNDTLDGLITYACKYAQEYFAVAGLRYRLEVPAQLPGTPIPPEVRHNVFLAFKEAVTNVVRHAHASAAWVRLKLEPTQFTLEVEDNGHGLSGEEDRTSRNGLRNMRQRMEDIKGRFSIGPAPAGGTVVRLTAPMGNL